MMTAVSDFFNQRADTWDDENAVERKAVSERIIRGLGIRPGSRVLDAGCGTGLIIPWLLEAVGEAGHVTALDIAERMLALAREKHAGPNLEFIHADLADTPFLDCSFDEVVCHNCFPHVADKRGAAQEMFRILRPGGRATVCHNESREEVNALHRFIGGEVGLDMLPGMDEMEEMFSCAGFVEVRVHDGEDMFVLVARKPGPKGLDGAGDKA
ncbi:MAG: methyltransferase domain-containing protein [Actinobacteria bacterium]|nr:methyltransferase domain-containing protein [Actinomycetota bacterium]